MYVLDIAGRDRCAAAVAAFGFAFNGLTLNCLDVAKHQALADARGWFGPSLAAAGKASFLSDGGAMQMLAGSPEIILFTLGDCRCVLASELWKGRIRKTAPEANAGSWRD